MLIRNRYLRNNIHAAKISRKLRKYYYTGFIAVALIACAGLASLHYATSSSHEGTVSSRRILTANEATSVSPAPSQRQILNEDSCARRDDSMEESGKFSVCKNFKCQLSNFCEYHVWPGPTTELQRDFVFPFHGWSRTKSQCEAVQATNFFDHVATSDLGDLGIHRNSTHIPGIALAEDQPWCRWDMVRQKCVHSMRFCSMLRTHALCAAHCPTFEWFNISYVTRHKASFKHLFKDPGKVWRFISHHTTSHHITANHSKSHHHITSQLPSRPHPISTQPAHPSSPSPPTPTFIHPRRPRS